MLKIKDTLRATVHMSFDGRVFKTYHGPNAKERFENEVRVLKFLESRGCNFVPRLLEADEKKCGSSRRTAERALITWTKNARRNCSPNWKNSVCGMTTADPRNVTYRLSDGRFCLIDFELATILPESKQ